MRISEIIRINESDDRIDLYKISNDVYEIIDNYRQGLLSTESALGKLQEYDNQIKNLIYDNDEYWKALSRTLPNSMNITEFAQGWIDLENTIEKYSKEIRNGAVPAKFNRNLHEQRRGKNYDKN